MSGFEGVPQVDKLHSSQLLGGFITSDRIFGDRLQVHNSRFLKVLQKDGFSPEQLLPAGEGKMSQKMKEYWVKIWAVPTHAEPANSQQFYRIYYSGSGGKIVSRSDYTVGKHTMKCIVLDLPN